MAGVGGHFLLLGIFPTQGSNPGVPHYRQNLYLNHQVPSTEGCVYCPNSFLFLATPFFILRLGRTGFFGVCFFFLKLFVCSVGGYGLEAPVN